MVVTSVKDMDNPVTDCLKTIKTKTWMDAGDNSEDWSMTKIKKKSHKTASYYGTKVAKRVPIRVGSTQCWCRL